MSERLKKSRIVKFQEDYSAGGILIYKKDSEHPIHQDTVDLLKKAGAKFKVEKIDIEKVTEAAKKAFEDAQDKEKS